MVEDVRLHTTAKEIALKELVEEQKEKLKLEQNNQNNQPKPTDQTNTPEEDNASQNQ